MFAKRAEQATCEVILVSGDDSHARELLDELAAAPRRYLLTRVGDLRAASATLSALMQRLPRPLPVLVMLDFEFLAGACESLARRVLALKDYMAVECLVTRPPPYGRLTERLRDMGVFLFDPMSEIPAV